MWRHFAVAVMFVTAAGCNHSTFDRDIVGVWENAGTPSSASLPESLRNSADWTSEIEFLADGTFRWSLENETGGKDRYAGSYKVLGYSLDLTIIEADGKRLADIDQMSYTVRQQSSGAIRLPLPQDWTGPSVDYFKKD